MVIFFWYDSQIAKHISITLNISFPVIYGSLLFLIASINSGNKSPFSYPGYIEESNSKSLLSSPEYNSPLPLLLT